MNEAYAQTAETIGAAGQVWQSYTSQAGIVAGTWLVVALGLCVLIWHLLKRLELRDREIADLKVKCAKEIEQAKLDAIADAQKQFGLAWERVNQIYNSVQALFGKSDATHQQVELTLRRLTNVLASRGVVDNG